MSNFLTLNVVYGVHQLMKKSINSEIVFAGSLILAASELV
jgi:hypothetical protein